VLPAAITSVTTRFRDALRGRFGARLRECVVYGSWARGEAGEESDLDLFVVVDGLTEDEHREVLSLAYDVDALDDEPFGLSPLVHSTEQAAELRQRGRRLFADIAREGIAL
jgi:predicted nucleotidyltransferase